jgi:YVTN family beta-propeller protein
MRGLRVGLIAWALVACSEDAPEVRAGGSGTAVVSADEQRLYVADGDNGALVQIDLATRTRDAVAIGAEPTRIARIGDRLYVTLRAEGTLAVVRLDGTPTVEARIALGAEPYGVVAAPDGRHVWVSVSLEDRVVEIDTSTNAVTRSIPVSGEPRWLVAHPSGKAVFVGCMLGGRVVRVDTISGDTKDVDLPGIDDPAAFDTGFRRDTGQDDDAPPPDGRMTPRITGDPAIDTDGGVLAIPVLYVDNDTSVGDGDPLDGQGDDPVFQGPRGGGGGYASGDPTGVTRFNPAVVSIPLTASGEPRGDQAQAMLVAGSVALVDVASPLAVADTGSSSVDRRRVRGYLASLAFTESGHALVATIEGGGSIAVIPTRSVEAGVPVDGSGGFAPGADSRGVGFRPAPATIVGTSAGARGVAVTSGGRGYVWGFLDRAVDQVDLSLAEGALGDAVLGNAPEVSFRADRHVELDPSVLSADVLAGRRLFYASDEPGMAAEGAGVSCATCHFDGRNDGLTWRFDDGVRQTPSLAGKVSETAPVTWTRHVGSVSEEAKITGQGRMGGAGVGDEGRAALAAYVDSTRLPSAPTVDAAAVARGKAVFERSDVGCSDCHGGARYTDNGFHAMVGIADVNTPSLSGVHASAPYFHDGSAATLADVVDMADQVGMGHTAQLSAAERADLVSYLTSL